MTYSCVITALLLLPSVVSRIHGSNCNISPEDTGDAYMHAIIYTLKHLAMVSIKEEIFGGLAAKIAMLTDCRNTLQANL